MVYPPAVPMVDQVLAYLDAKPVPPEWELAKCSRAGRAGVAAVAVCVRWGTYFALLADQNLPQWEVAADKLEREQVSRIDDEEMGRINVEASSAFAKWTERALGTMGSFEFEDLVAKAVTYLPMSSRCAKRPKASRLYAMGSAELAAEHGEAILNAHHDVAFRLAASAAFPSRVFANTCINATWRNGPVEDIHAGHHRGTPLDRRRITPQEERTLMRLTAGGLAAATEVIAGSVWTGRPWTETVQLFNLVGLILVPSRWALTADSRVMRLHDWE